MTRLASRIWSAHPLTPVHRLVLLAVARHVPADKTDVLVSRATIARGLETTARAVTQGLLAGELLGLCRVLNGGVVSFTPEGLPGLSPAAEAAVQELSEAAVAPAPAQAPTGNTNRQVMADFTSRWEAHYGQRYVPQYPRDGKLAADLARALTPADVQRRVDNYLTHADPFYAQCAHSFAMFAGRINDFATRRKAPHPDAAYDRLKKQTDARRAAMRQGQDS